ILPELPVCRYQRKIAYKAGGIAQPDGGKVTVPRIVGTIAIFENKARRNIVTPSSFTSLRRIKRKGGRVAPGHGIFIFYPYPKLQIKLAVIPSFIDRIIAVDT